MKKEEWKDIEGYKGLYKISNYGRIKSAINRYQKKSLRESGGILKPHRIQGYDNVTLYKNAEKRRFMVHRLVACAFVENPNPELYIHVNHKDENPSNNYFENLEWCTHSYNINYGTRNERSALKQSKPIFQMSLNGEVLKEYKSISEAFRFFKVSSGAHIIDVCKGRRNKAFGYKWAYKDEKSN